MGNGSRSHHLLKHTMPAVDIMQHFGSAEPKEVAREINKLGQRDLQAKFRAVYGTQTYSNNNCWLRRKLMEAAGLQTPKASSRGRPAVRQGRAFSPASDAQSDGPCMSRSGSMGSQALPDRIQAPEANVMRRTKRAHKPKQYEDMLVFAQLPGHQASDDEDSRLTKVAAMEPGRSDMQAHRNTPELVWSRSPSQSFISSHLISAPSTALSVSIAPTTPEKSGFCGAVPAMIAARQGSTASKLLGPQEVLGMEYSNLPSTLPAWADLPSNDRASSQDLDEVSFQMQEEPETAACMPATMNVPSAAAEVLIAPATPDRMAPARRASAMHLLHDMPNLPAMGMLLTRPAASQKGAGMDFDYFAAPPPTVTSPELLPSAPANFEKGMDFPMMSSLGTESAGSDMSALDVLLEEFGSNQMTQEFDAWLKDMPCPELEPCKI